MVKMTELSWQGNAVVKLSGLRGDMRVMQDDSRRWLVFEGSEAIQSCMLRNTPWQLVLPYQQSMMVWPLFMSSVPKQLAIIGVGGGDMIRYLQHAYPAAAIVAVDEDPVMLKMACEYFSLQPGAKLALQVDTAEQFLQRPQSPQDLLMIDIIAGDAAPACIYEQSFWEDCHHAMTAQGIVVANVIPGSEAAFVGLLETIRSVFGRLPLCASIAGHRNIVMFITPGTIPIPDLDALQLRANKLAVDSGLPVDDVMQVLKADNKIQNNRFCL